MHFLAQLFQKLSSDRAKKSTFRMSVLSPPKMLTMENLQKSLVLLSARVERFSVSRLQGLSMFFVPGGG